MWIQTGNRLGIRPEKWDNKDFENYKRFSRAVGWYDDQVGVNETGSSSGFVSYEGLLSRIKKDPLLSPRGSLPKNLAHDYSVSNQGVLFSDCDLLAAQEWKDDKPDTIALVVPQPSDDLSSEKNIDYTRLRDLLAARNWKDADYETYLVMLKVVGRKEGDWIRDEELLNFPCTDLRTIDNLWVKYSNGRFGFSVQKKIYLEIGGVPDGKRDEEAWEKFGDHVGWRMNGSWINYRQVTFDTISLVGHLPIPGIDVGYSHIIRIVGSSYVVRSGFSSLASRLVKCNL
ncbi:GUN4 domain-containing protein [Iningainema sp. BLCCT55]|uniref:GUN4 domain-containing protein n=1 Tax=Iningainema tapete BLCC-T55 TaxID=2748662 RepID=A0A8J6XLK7_9CYAN|nr:GUN4 domain-containing protein [Iningainema tapete BLCC-T55]